MLGAPIVPIAATVEPEVFAVILGSCIAPMFAKNWQWLFLLAALSALPAIVVYLLASWETDPWAPVAVLIIASPAALGITARALSLVAEKLGHPRPYSLWIEALFVSPAILYLILIASS